MRHTHNFSPDAMCKMELTRIFRSFPGRKFDDFPEAIKKQIKKLTHNTMDAGGWQRYWFGRHSTGSA